MTSLISDDVTFWKKQSESLLSPLNDCSSKISHTRREINYENRSDAFMMKKTSRDFKKQYAHIYAAR